MLDVRVQSFREGVEVDVVHAVLLADLLDYGGYRRVVVLRPAVYSKHQHDSGRDRVSSGRRRQKHQATGLVL